MAEHLDAQPRIAALEAELAEARAWNSTLADTADALRAELGGARKALAASGIGGIYDVFQDVADAIEQMALYIKERDRHVTELEEEIVRLRLLANANVRVAAQTLGRPITRAEALAISHATLENAEAERIASDTADDTADALAQENARLKETVGLFARCMQRANHLWCEAHPDAPPCIPDGADVIVWLKEQVDALAERRCETRAHYDGAEHTRICWMYDTYMDPDDFCSRWQAREYGDES